MRHLTMTLILALAACDTATLASTGTPLAEACAELADDELQQLEATLAVDADGDGYTEAVDCDDEDPAVGPAVGLWHDADGDGYGDAEHPVDGCLQGDEYVTNADDCAPADPDLHPGTVWYADADGDGYGDPTTTTRSCVQGYGYTDDASDCDDGDADEHPGAAEVCDGADNDCDGVADEDAPLVTLHPDTDGDGYGSDDPALAVTACNAEALVGDPDVWVLDGTDCDDSDVATYPGAPDPWYGGDNDCDGM
jgi:hypothetical protein